MEEEKGRISSNPIGLPQVASETIGPLPWAGSRSHLLMNAALLQTSASFVQSSPTTVRSAARLMKAMARHMLPAGPTSRPRLAREAYYSGLSLHDLQERQSQLQGYPFNSNWQCPAGCLSLLSWRLLHPGDLRGGIEEHTARSAWLAHRPMTLHFARAGSLLPYLRPRANTTKWSPLLSLSVESVLLVTTESAMTRQEYPGGPHRIWSAARH